MIFKEKIKKVFHDKGYPLYDFMRRNGFIEQTNLNLNLCDLSQKRVLICYVPIPNYDFSEIIHAQSAHINQIIYNFTKRGFCVNVCYANDIQSYRRICHYHYDVVFGFGSAYKQACMDNPEALKISFIMENHPDVVSQKYSDRIRYFKSRHPHIDISSSIVRSGFFDADQFKLSDAGILMSSRYNSLNFSELRNKILLINCNSIFNKKYEFVPEEVIKSISSSRRNFLWFGSVGLIHKGLDIVIDAFKELPDLSLNVYGLDKKEYGLFEELKADNTYNKKRINVLSDEFITDVVKKHNFMILDSCSEGMSTAVSTCMAHGIIPIVSMECGFNEAPCIIRLEDNSVEGVKAAIQKACDMSDEEVLAMRKDCYEYARNQFSLEHFDHVFYEELNKILNM